MLTLGSLNQIEVGHGKKAIVIFVPVPSLQGFHRVQQRYVFCMLSMSGIRMADLVAIASLVSWRRSSRIVMS
jgi:hypothetical protein